MTGLVSHPETDYTAVDDGPAIGELHRLYALQRKAFRENSYPSADERKANLGRLAGMILSHRDDIRAAMRSDFGSHPDLFTDLVEVLGVAGRAAFAIEQLDAWMAPEDRQIDPAFWGTAQASIRQQPKGVVGVIVPWNFPFDLSVGPLVEILAAGNRAVIKPSDYTPACGELLRRMVSETFPEDLVTVTVGGFALAKEFPTLRWDHLLYTGSPAIGREIAMAAAENLVPVTLELGGKCPAILTEDAVDAETVRSVIALKMVKNGQMCITIDHVMVPRAQMSSFVEHAQAFLEERMPQYASSDDNTGIITLRHLDRILDLVEEARGAGGHVVSLGGEGDPDSRRLPLTLVVDPPKDTRLMKEEVFGPILPVVPYDDLDTALAELNAGERPLGIYVYSKDVEAGERVLSKTTSGGACINGAALQGTMPSLGFGGVGQSGSGRHHGIDGFREFSNPRGVVVRGTGDMADAFLPPYGPLAQAIVDSIIRPVDSGEAPTNNR